MRTTGARVIGGFGALSSVNGAAVRQAVCEAAEQRRERCRGDLRGSNSTSDAFRSQKSVEQQDLQSIHRVRSRLVGCRMHFSELLEELFQAC